MINKKIRLRTLISFLSMGAVASTALILLGTLTLYQKLIIEENIVQNNIAYAHKLADTTDRYLNIAQNELKWSASQIKGLGNPEQLRNEANRLRLQSGFFNSVVIVNKDRIIRATSPESFNLVGHKLISNVSVLATTSQKPFISEPFTSTAGNYVVFLSQPIFSSDQKFLGYIGGTIYLKKHSMLSDILSQHFYAEGTKIMIINNNGEVIFSHNPDIVGKKEHLPPSINKQISSRENGRFITHSMGNEYQTGYASLSQTDWHILVSGDENTVNQKLSQVVKKSIWFIFVIVLFIGTLMIFLGTRIASPLEQLANLVRDGGNNDNEKSSPQNIQAWYSEAYLLKDAVIEHLRITQVQVSELTDKAMTDPLTGTLNRRGFYYRYKKLKPDTLISAIVLDIDHFKKVNDQFGHDAGDKVLIMLSEVLQESCRLDDIVGRFGGEEFIILLPEVTPIDAMQAAERIRKKISSTIFPFVGYITVSAGVATMHDIGDDLQNLLHRADEALYEAKGKGRNQVIIATASGFIQCE